MKNISLEINGVLFDKLTVAENHQDMTEGLENRTQMDADEGMIYVFDSDSNIAFVNENRWLDIDMIMVDGQGKITAVHTMKKAVFKDDETEEEHLASRPYYPSSAPYQYVFELKSGMAKKIGAEVGKRLDVDYAQLYQFRNARQIFAFVYRFFTYLIQYISRNISKHLNVHCNAFCISTLPISRKHHRNAF
jgi:uncharacterized membrane protein (UPF0127 family)